MVTSDYLPRFWNATVAFDILGFILNSDYLLTDRGKYICVTAQF